MHFSVHFNARIPLPRRGLEDPSVLIFTCNTLVSKRLLLYDSNNNPFSGCLKRCKMNAQLPYLPSTTSTHLTITVLSSVRTVCFPYVNCSVFVCVFVRLLLLCCFVFGCSILLMYAQYILRTVNLCMHMYLVITLLYPKWVNLFLVGTYCNI